MGKQQAAASDAFQVSPAAVRAAEWRNRPRTAVCAWARHSLVRGTKGSEAHPRSLVLLTVP